MSADVALIRRAAALIRARAEKATPGLEEWWKDGRALAWATKATGAPGLAEHLASWHPAVALAVAAWLEQMADHIQAWDEGVPTCDVGGPGDQTCTAAALAVVHAYLGESA